jgi:Holliday junction DNA helicase RuvA
MISAITGELRRVDEDRLHLAVGPVLVEMLVPASDVPLLQGAVGQEMTFHTILYFEGDAAGGGGLEPRLVGFLRPEDKRFFEKFITVKGIGPK